MLETIAAQIITNTVSSGTTILSDALKRKNSELLQKHKKSRNEDKQDSKPTKRTATFSATPTILENALKRHVEDINSWCKQIKFSDLRGTKSISQVYVQLDTYLMPISVHESASEKSQTEPLLTAIKSSPYHCAILGTAGAGKTTSLQKICSDYFTNGKGRIQK